MAKISISDLRPAAGASGNLSFSKELTASENELTQVRGGLWWGDPPPRGWVGFWILGGAVRVGFYR